MSKGNFKKKNIDFIRLGQREISIKEVPTLLMEIENENATAKRALAVWDKLRLVGFLPGSNSDGDKSFVASSLKKLFDKYGATYSRIDLTKVR